MADQGFFAKLFGLFMGKDDKAETINRLLKKQQQQLKGYSKYYKLGTEELQPYVAQLIYAIYYILAPYKASMLNVAKSDQLKNIVVTSFLEPKQQELLNNLDPENMRQRLAHQNANKIKEELQAEAQLIAAYLANTVMSSEINMSYAYIVSLSNFMAYDFYRFLTHFDTNLPSNNFTYKPHFQAVQARLLLDDMIEFVQVIVPVLGGDIEWGKLFKILSNYRNAEFIDEQKWSKALKNIDEMIHDDVFTLIIRRVSKNPYWEDLATLSVVDIVKPFNLKLKQNIDSLIQKLGNQEREKMTNKISQEVFSGQDFSHTLQNYTEERSSSLFNGVDVVGFSYANVMNAVSFFAKAYLVSEVQKTVDLLILQGKWSNNEHYKQFSQAFQALVSHVKDIEEFDAKLMDDASSMVRLRNALRNANKEKAALNTARGILGEINDDAMILLGSLLQNYSILARSLKVYIDDYKKQLKSEIILNWKEVEHRCEVPLAQMMASVYTRIYYLIQMINQYVSQ